MELRRPRPESLLAWAAAAVGVIGVVSALTPEMRDRLGLNAQVRLSPWEKASKVSS